MVKESFVKKIEQMSPEEVNKRQREIIKQEMSPIVPMEYVYSGKDEEVSYESDELSAVCPQTGLPDTYKLTIIYTPDKRIPELKSLRFYILSYREIPIFHEHLCQKIYLDLLKILKPRRLEVMLDVAVRGGIHTIVRKKSAS